MDLLSDGGNVFHFLSYSIQFSSKMEKNYTNRKLQLNRMVNSFTEVKIIEKITQKVKCNNTTIFNGAHPILSR